MNGCDIMKGNKTLVRSVLIFTLIMGIMAFLVMLNSNIKNNKYETYNNNNWWSWFYWKPCSSFSSKVRRKAIPLPS